MSDPVGDGGPSSLPFKRLETKPRIHLGSPPDLSQAQIESWTLEIDLGEAIAPLQLVLSDLKRNLLARSIRHDLRCVAGWETLQNEAFGVSIREIIGLPDATSEVEGIDYAILESADGYIARVSLIHLFHKDAFLVWGTSREIPLERDEGGPLRVILPHLFGWKSVKWIRKISLGRRAVDAKGFWEERNYASVGTIENDDRGPAWSAAKQEADADRGDTEFPKIHHPGDGAPEVIVITADWNDGASTGLAECARILLAELESSGRPYLAIGPCSAHPDYVRFVLKKWEKSPVIFFLHGHKFEDPTTTQYYLLGQKRHDDETNNILLTHLESADFFQDRVVFAVSCFSAEILRGSGAIGVGFLNEILVVLKENRVFHDTRRWRCFCDPLLHGAISLLNGSSPDAAIERMRAVFKELLPSCLPDEANERTTFGVFATVWYDQLKYSLAALS